MTRPVSFFRNERGAIAIEMAFMVPVLLLMFVGIMEVTRLVLIHQKLEKTANTLADIVAQAESMSTTQLNTIMGMTEHLMSPYNMGSNGIVMVTYVTKTGTAQPRVAWQSSGGGTLTGKTSHIGFTGGFAALPGTFTLNNDQSAVLAEAYYTFTPLFGSYLLGTRNLYKVAVFKPRLGAMGALTP